MQQCIIFSIEKGLKGGSQEKRGVSEEFKIREVRGLDPPAPAPSEWYRYYDITSCYFNILKLQSLK